jgi:L,D-peptidoglycan transpeptidase YkuD (ErfK/YbiS/YcfS/YnhG family)
MTIFLKNKHTLQVDNFYFQCCIGKNGNSIKKKEGDKKTPTGIFKIEHLYFRKDRLKKPETALKCIEIKNNMAWCDDIRYPKKKKRL